MKLFILALKTGLIIFIQAQYFSYNLEYVKDIWDKLAERNGINEYKVLLNLDSARSTMPQLVPSMSEGICGWYQQMEHL